MKEIISAVLLLALVAGCGDTEEEAFKKCQSLGPLCESGAAVNCEVQCSMTECFPMVEKVKCGQGAACSVQTFKVEGQTVDAAVCLMEPETVCDPYDDSVNTCTDEQTVQTCDWELNKLVRYSCEPVDPQEDSHVIQWGCTTKGEQLVCSLGGVVTSD